MRRRFPPVGSWTALGTPAVIVLALVLRTFNVGWGLPSFLEEALPFRVALSMTDAVTGHVTLNPHFFNYPSLTCYLHLALTQCLYTVGHLARAYPSYADYLLAYYVDPSLMVLAARLLHVVADLATVLATIRLGQALLSPAGWAAGLLTAISPIMVLTARSIYVDTVMAACLLWGLERLVAWQTNGSPRVLFASAVLIGLATSAKYPAFVALVPLLWAAYSRGGAGSLPLALKALVCFVAAFALTSPYVFLDYHAALHDIAFEREHVALGHLGSLRHASFLFHLRNLSSTLGPVGTIGLCISPFLLLSPRLRVSTGYLLITGVLLGAPIALAHIDAQRYVAPLVPIAALLSTLALCAALSKVAVAQRALLTVVAILGVVIPPALAGISAALSGSQDTQVIALQWCQDHLPHDALIIEEGYSAPLPSRAKKAEVASQDVYRHASAASRHRFDSVAAYDVVSMPLQVTGLLELALGAADGGSSVAPIAAVDLNQVYYNPGLYRAADYVITSSAVRGRYEADAARFAPQVRWYRLLDGFAQVVATVRPTRSTTGPTITVYRVTPTLRGRLGSAAEEVSPLWWSTWVPESYIKQWNEREHLAGSAALRVPGASVAPAWLRPLRPIYMQRIKGFSDELAYAALQHGDSRTAEQLLATSLLMGAADISDTLAYSVCLGRRGAWREADTILGRALDGASSQDSSVVLLQRARVAARLGEPARQRAYLAQILRREQPGSEMYRLAGTELGRSAIR
ncbi:MAG: hypothetical protein HZC42_01145 [Candidatus Eisenbacteria bacterium]|nr:hypothetical protein [Candidatus Eisenbacteria bacterium]